MRYEAESDAKTRRTCKASSGGRTHENLFMDAIFAVLLSVAGFADLCLGEQMPLPPLLASLHW